MNMKIIAGLTRNLVAIGMLAVLMLGLTMFSDNGGSSAGLSHQMEINLHAEFTQFLAGSTKGIADAG